MILESLVFHFLPFGPLKLNKCYLLVYTYMMHSHIQHILCTFLLSRTKVTRAVMQICKMMQEKRKKEVRGKLA